MYRFIYSSCVLRWLSCSIYTFSRQKKHTHCVKLGKKLSVVRRMLGVGKVSPPSFYDAAVDWLGCEGWLRVWPLLCRADVVWMLTLMKSLRPSKPCVKRNSTYQSQYLPDWSKTEREGWEMSKSALFYSIQFNSTQFVQHLFTNQCLKARYNKEHPREPVARKNSLVWVC